MGHDALYGFAVNLFPAIVASLLIQRYAMYLVKLGRSRISVGLFSLVLMGLVTFSLSCVTAFLAQWIFKPEGQPWLMKGGLIAGALCLFITWVRVCLKLFRYQVSYFIEYTYPRQSIIRGVPLAILAVFSFAFWRSGLIESGAEWMAHKTHNPAFCRVAEAKDHCQEQFYDPLLVRDKPVDPNICRALSGSHVVKCLIAHHPAQPDSVSCKSLREREGENSPVYYWCLSFLPKAKETIEACRRAESSSHWINMFYGNCLQSSNMNNRTDSGKTAVMQLLDVQNQSEHPAGLLKLGVKYPLPIRANLAALLQNGLDLDKVDRDGRNLLFYVHKVEDLNALLAHGIRTNQVDVTGMTAPMVWMSSANATEYEALLEALVKRGYDMNLGDKKGRTALTHLLLNLKSQSENARHGANELSLVESLLKLGANPYLRDKNKKRPVDYAREFGMEEILTALRSFRQYQTGADAG